MRRVPAADEKPLHWVGSSKRDFLSFPAAVKGDIGNALGKFIDRANKKYQYDCAHICVEVDLEVGLPEAIKIKVGNWTHLQKLDYEQLPFKCRKCHVYSHFTRGGPTNVESDKGKEEG